MPPITALVHTENDALRLGRTLETLRVCDEVIVVDHGSRDASLRLAREYGTRIVEFRADAPAGYHLQSARHEWIFCVEPCESVSEALEATLLAWKSSATTNEPAFSVSLRDETPEGWAASTFPQVRLVPRNWARWERGLPQFDRSAVPLEGELLRFVFP